MNTTERINKVNETLSEMGSVFRADEDCMIVGYFGNLTFLKRQFKSLEELENYVERCRVLHKKGVCSNEV